MNTNLTDIHFYPLCGTSIWTSFLFQFLYFANFTNSNSPLSSFSAVNMTSCLLRYSSERLLPFILHYKPLFCIILLINTIQFYCLDVNSIFKNPLIATFDTIYVSLQSSLPVGRYLYLLLQFWFLGLFQLICLDFFLWCLSFMRIN